MKDKLKIVDEKISCVRQYGELLFNESEGIKSDIVQMTNQLSNLMRHSFKELVNFEEAIEKV